MDEAAVRRVLAQYCPPLSPSQVDSIVKEIAFASGKELAAAKTKAPKSKKQGKLGSQKRPGVAMDELGETENKLEK